MKNIYLLSASLCALLATASVMAQQSDSDCDETIDDCSGAGSIKEPVKTIYPYRPFETDLIKKRLELLTEKKDYIWNIYKMEGLEERKTEKQPWAGPYWQLNRGMIANPYLERSTSQYVFAPHKMLSWRTNVKMYKDRQKTIHENIDDLDEDELAILAPSEKYDLLLGDTSFDLTNKIWSRVDQWGHKKKWAYLSAIQIPDGYRIPEMSTLMAQWEGICHGWATASGNVPRPEKTVWVTLANGKKMPFYPNDIKALVSLMWANSLIQDNVIFEGNRCNKKNPDTDKYGRFIDTEKFRDDKVLLPRCADVHPAIFHVAMVNILGKEGRSFVIDHNPKAAVGNQPVAEYEFEYYHPETGKTGPLQKSLVPVETYEDPFEESRNPETTHIVGIRMRLWYSDWEAAEFSETNSDEDDKLKEMKFSYDLEINAEGNVVGGQWRVSETGKKRLIGETGQPDYFFVIPRNWKSYFKDVDGLPAWTSPSTTLPPTEYLSAAKTAHSFIYEKSARFNGGVSHQCPVVPVDGGAQIFVNCEFKEPQPQPLFNVINALVKEASNGK